MLTEDQICVNVEQLRNKIEKGGYTGIQIIAVTKTHQPEVFDICSRCDLFHIGENRPQELRDKLPQAEAAGMAIHFIGPLQKNKIKYLAEGIYSYDSLYDYDIAEAFSEVTSNPDARVLVQINATGEPQKAGLRYKDNEEVFEFIKKVNALNYINVEGFMAMGPTPDGNYRRGDRKYDYDTRKAFSRLRELKSDLESQFGLNLPRLSMGMSSDYDLALQEGATEIRIGSLLFGAREDDQNNGSNYSDASESSESSSEGSAGGSGRLPKGIA